MRHVGQAQEYRGQAASRNGRRQPKTDRNATQNRHPTEKKKLRGPWVSNTAGRVRKHAYALVGFFVREKSRRRTPAHKHGAPILRPPDHRPLCYEKIILTVIYRGQFRAAVRLFLVCARAKFCLNARRALFRRRT